LALTEYKSRSSLHKMCWYKIGIYLGFLQRTKSGEVEVHICTFEHSKHPT
jgi:hypothetical protein